MRLLFYVLAGLGLAKDASWFNFQKAEILEQEDDKKMDNEEQNLAEQQKTEEEAEQKPAEQQKTEEEAEQKLAEQQKTEQEAKQKLAEQQKRNEEEQKKNEEEGKTNEEFDKWKERDKERNEQEEHEEKQRRLKLEEDERRAILEEKEMVRSHVRKLQAIPSIKAPEMGAWLYADYKRVLSTDSIDCADDCEKDENCYHWNFEVHQSHCDLKNNNGGYHSNDHNQWVMGHSSRWTGKMRDYETEKGHSDINTL